MKRRIFELEQEIARALVAELCPGLLLPVR